MEDMKDTMARWAGQAPASNPTYGQTNPNMSNQVRNYNLNPEYSQQFMNQGKEFLPGQTVLGQGSQQDNTPVDNRPAVKLSNTGSNYFMNDKPYTNFLSAPTTPQTQPTKNAGVVKPNGLGTIGSTGAFDMTKLMEILKQMGLQF